VRVLVVEDEAKMRGLLRRGLQHYAFAVDVAATGVDAVWAGCEIGYDAIVLDLRLPDIEGFEVCRQLRERECWVPILMLTAMDDVEDRVQGLDAGADDYLVKPFEFDELAARLRALLRRGSRPRPTQLRVGDLVLDPSRRTVQRAGSAIDLTPREFGLLECLMRHRGEVLSRRRLLHHVWDEVDDADPHVVNVYVGYLREKIDRPFGRSSLRTVRGSGYVIDDHGTP
jgi:two-component system, OmpR family, response regulator